MAKVALAFVLFLAVQEQVGLGIDHHGWSSTTRHSGHSFDVSRASRARPSLGNPSRSSGLLRFDQRTSVVIRSLTTR